MLSFAKKPAIGLDLRVAGGEVTKVPWLKKELEGGVLQGLEDTMLWPIGWWRPRMTSGGGPCCRPRNWLRW